MSTYLKHINNFGMYLSRFSASIVCASILIMMGMITLNVTARYFFNHPIDFVEEYSAFIFVLIVFMGLGHVTRKDMHIRVDLLYNYFPEKYRTIINLFTFSLSLIVAIIYFYFAVIGFYTSWEMNESSIITQTPIWIPKLFMVIGLFIFIIEIINWIISLSTQYFKTRLSVNETRK